MNSTVACGHSMYKQSKNVVLHVQHLVNKGRQSSFLTLRKVRKFGAVIIHYTVLFKKMGHLNYALGKSALDSPNLITHECAIAYFEAHIQDYKMHHESFSSKVTCSR